MLFILESLAGKALSPFRSQPPGSVVELRERSSYGGMEIMSARKVRIRPMQEGCSVQVKVTTHQMPRTLKADEVLTVGDTFTLILTSPLGTLTLRPTNIPKGGSDHEISQINPTTTDSEKEVRITVE